MLCTSMCKDNKNNSYLSVSESVLGRQIINLEEFRCPTFKNLPRINEHFCFHHGKKAEYLICALDHAYKLRRWLLNTVYTLSAKAAEEKEGKKDLDLICGKVKNLGLEVDQAQASSVAPPKPFKRKRSGSRCNIYDSVDNEFATNSSPTKAHSGDDSRSVSDGQDTVRTGETLCNCS